jgi:hypothetical protein
MPTRAQLKKIWLLSDTVLYPEAVDFMQRHVQQSEPLPNSQVMGLFNAAASEQYPVLYRFVTHQRDRNWPYAKMHIKRFYTALEQTLLVMQRTRIRNEFRLLEDVPGRSVAETRQEQDTLMALLAREFIQHLLAENAVLLLRGDKGQKAQGARGGDGGRQQQGRQGQPGQQGQPGRREQPGQQRPRAGEANRPQQHNRR